MIIKYGQYNVPRVIVDTEGITTGTAKKIGTKEEYQKLRNICKESGLFIIESITIDGNKMGGACNANLFDAGIDFGCPTHFGEEVNVVTGTVSVSGNDCMLLINIGTFE